ncbi:MAG: class II aldolase/adducin family protein [Actinocrinis sp.]
MTADEHSELRERIAVACRIMAVTGLVENILGHISARISPEELLIRCRGPREAGLAYTTAEDVRAVPLRGTAASGATGEWRPPNELPIHTAVLRARPETTVVVHAHPPAVVAFSLLDRPLEPIYGAYDIPGSRLAADGVPVWPRSALINSDAPAGEMLGAMGERPAVILRGHGVVTAASGPPHLAVAEAVLTALAVDALARHSLTVLQSGGTPRPIGAEDLAALPDLGGGFNVEVLWRHLERRLRDAQGGRAGAGGDAPDAEVGELSVTRS